MNEHEATLDTYFFVHKELLDTLAKLTANHVVTAPSHLITSFDFINDGDLPPLEKEMEEKLAHAAQAASMLETFSENREYVEKMQQLQAMNPLCTSEDIAAMMHHFEPKRPHAVNYRSVEYPHELLLTSITLRDERDEAYARRTIVAKTDELITETYTITYLNRLPVSMSKDIRATSEDTSSEDPDVAQETREFLAQIGFDNRPAVLELSRLVRYLQDFPPLSEY